MGRCQLIRHDCPDNKKLLSGVTQVREQEMNVPIDLLLVFTVAVAIEGVHAALVDSIKANAPALYQRLGSPQYGYYFLGKFWGNSAYRRFITSRKFVDEFVDDQRMLFLANVEFILWY